MYRSKHYMAVQGDSVPNPVLSFAEVNFPDPIALELKRQPFVTPTPIQSQVCACRFSIVSNG